MTFISNLFAVFTVASFGSVSGVIVPVQLRTEYKVNPEGIGEIYPRFSWQMQTTERNQYQSAYQIIVAADEDSLSTETNLLWDTGKTLSSEMLHIPYAGFPLQSRMRCWWKVRIWNQKDVASPWSEPAMFSVGLLHPSDWEAQWIGYDKTDTLDLDSVGAPSLEKAKWIWFPEGNPAESAPAEERWFRRSFMLPEDSVVVSARLFITADDAVEPWVNGNKINIGQPSMANWKMAFQHLVAAHLQGGQNTIAVKAKNSGGPAGLLVALRIHLRDENPVDLYSDSEWKTSAGKARKEWIAPDYDDSSWAFATEIAPFGAAPWRETTFHQAQFHPVTHLRRNFETKGEIVRATLYATALGLYRFFINGTRVGEDYFAPGWTDYRERLYYRTYDVTHLVRSTGRNAVGAWLANGWYAGHVGLKGPELYGTKPRLLAQIEVEYADGTRECIPTNETWHAAHGEIRGADLLMGETRDKRAALWGWDSPEYDDSQWDNAQVDTPEIVPKRIEAYPGAPVKHFETLPARSMTEPKPGVYVYDLGQNMVGWVRLQVTGNRGQRIQVRHAEMLQDDGTIYTDALRSAQATDTYILAGDGVEVLEPAFTFHGFRFVEIRGIHQPLPNETVQGIVLNSDVPITAAFETSNPLLNQLAHNIVWGLKGNYLEIPTDCPQRDERLGWTGDAQFFMPTALYTADIGAFYTKWLVDLIQDGQLEDGSFPHVAPDVKLGGGAVAWGDAAIICPWLFYQFYGDTRVIERHFNAMIKGMDFLERTSKNYIRNQLGFGDWLNLGGGAKDEVICTAYYAYLAQIMAQMAAVIGRSDEAERFALLHQNIKNAFISAFVDEEGRIQESSQTGYALAFAFDLIPDSLQEKAAAHFVNEIARFDWHLATGFIGTPRLLPALGKAGRDDVAYRLLLNTTYPSWLFQVTLGATTMWERWNGWTPDKGFENPDMNSFNHYAFGAVGEWMYSHIVGIRPETPGCSVIRVEPMPGGDLSFAKMTYQSIRGPVSSAWRLDKEKMELNVSIPGNTTAKVKIPAKDVTDIYESDKPLEATGILVLSKDESGIVCQIGSGNYKFVAVIK